MVKQDNSNGQKDLSLQHSFEDKGKVIYAGCPRNNVRL